MTLYRGPGGTGSATSDADTTLYQEFLIQTQAARDAALQAETNAELAEANAEAAEAGVAASAAAAASSASAAASSASSASTSATNAASSASSASTSASNASSSASSASSSASAASTSATNAASSATAAASSASAASTSATNAANSATNASNSASTATTQATNAASSATAAASSATAAQSARTAAEAARDAALSAYDNFDDRYLGPKSSDPTLDNDGNALIAGALYFNTATNVMKVYDGSTWVAAYVSAAGVLLAVNNLSDLSNTATARANLNVPTRTGGDASGTWGINVTGNAATVTNGVYTTGDQTIAGTKTFSSNPILSAGTVNGLAFLNASKVLTTGSALTFDGTTLINTSGNFQGYDNLTLTAFVNGTNGTVINLTSAGTGGTTRFSINNSEQMRLTSTGLGIGTSSPGAKLDVNTGGASNTMARFTSNGSYYSYILSSGVTSVFSADTSGNNSFTVRGASNQLEFYTNAAERMRLDSSGNLGLGVTPSAWGGAFRALQIGGNPVITGANAPDFCGNAYHDGTNWRYIGTNFAARYSVNQNNGGIHAWFTAPSGTAGNAISFTQAMTLDASGNWAVGTTSTTYRVNVGGSNARVYVNSGDTSYAVFNAANSSGQFVLAVDNSTGSGYGMGGYSRVLYSDGAYPIAFATNNAERARITSGGALLLGSTVGGSDERLWVETTTADWCIQTNSTGSGTFYHISLRANGTQVGTITSTSTTTTYGTSSDYRLKDNVQPMTGALAKVAALKPVTYKWKADGSDGEGFIAHELAEICPYAVVGEKDAVDENGNIEPQNIDTSFLVATLTAAIQELKAEFDAYKATHP